MEYECHISLEIEAMKLRLPLSLAALLVLGACATATPYQAATETGARGYAEQQVESNRWQVSFAGNSLTDRETVETYLLYRAAELTAQQGYDYFRVANRETETDRRTVPAGFGHDPYYSGFYCNYRFYGRRGLVRYYPSRFYNSRTFRRHAHWHYDPFFDGYYDREIIRYDASAEILLGRGSKPNSPEYYDAADVLNTLSAKIVRPEI